MLAVGLLAGTQTELFYMPFAILESSITLLPDDILAAVIIMIVVLFYTPVQIVLAVVAGKLAARYRLAIVRR